MEYGNKVKYVCNKCGRPTYYYKSVSKAKCLQQGCNGTMIKAKVR